VPAGSVITEARALRTDELPREIIRRHDQMNVLASALDPAVDGLRPEPTIIHGPSGAGKTAVARRGVQKLKSEVLNISSAYVEGWARSSASVLRRIVRSIPRAPVHDSVGRQALIDRLRGHEDDIVVILDEMDQLRECGCLHELFGTRGVIVVGTVSQFRELCVAVDQRIASRLRSARRISFDVYTDDELVAILEDRSD
jgi:Cdc6-like AAA superfamily ATPase